MYGHLHIVIREYVIGQFGEESWKQVINETKCGQVFNEHQECSDDITKQILDACVQTSGYPRKYLLTSIGEYYFRYLTTSPHKEMLTRLGDTMGAFMDNLDYLHTFHLDKFPNMKMPHFRCEKDLAGGVTKLHYYSVREGLYPLVVGVLQEVAKCYYKKLLQLNVESKSFETMGEAGSPCEHVIFAVFIDDISSRSHDAPPTLIAQTKKHAERQIIKNDVERVAERLEEIKREYGEDALPLNRAKAAQAKWKALAKMSMLRGGFLPSYPPRLSVDARTFCQAFPYHLVFDKDMQVIHCGVKIQQMIPSSKQKGSRVELLFELLHPTTVTFTFENVCKVINTPFLLRMKTSKLAAQWRKHTPLVLKGQMLCTEQEGHLLYLCSPYVRCLHDLTDVRMYVSDIPLFDVTRDVLFFQSSVSNPGSGVTNDQVTVNTRFQKTNENSKHFPGFIAQQESTNVLSATPRPWSRDKSGAPYSTGTGEDAREMQAQMRKLRAVIAAERNKTEQLYTSQLPPYVIKQLMNSQVPEPGVYENASVLFCDVVGFTQILQKCTAAETLSVLTQLHNAMNHVCDVHGTYRVNSIGDAFLVLSGVPGPDMSHVERLANTALAMMLLAGRISSPIAQADGSTSIKIRIGMEVGRVVCGVLGDDVPRFMVMGDAVNRACKMESHGLAEQIHVTQNVYQLLRRKPFRISKRGNVDIRGQGRITTYVLVANETLTDDELIGRNRFPPKAVAPDTVIVRSVHSPGTGRSSSTSGSLTPQRNQVAPLASRHDSPFVTKLDRGRNIYQTDF